MNAAITKFLLAQTIWRSVTRVAVWPGIPGVSCLTFSLDQSGHRTFRGRLCVPRGAR